MEKTLHLSDALLTTRFSFQIAMYLLVKQKENLTSDEMSLRALFRAPLQLHNLFISFICKS